MNLTDFTLHVSSTLLPQSLWNYYYRYLWDYRPDSWVSRIANSFRVLAILVVLPILILGLLDISSYGIARSLGVIDDVKASTSDKATIHHDKDTPSILIQESLTPNESIFPQTREGTLSGLDSSTGHASRDVINGSNDTDLLNVSQPDAYYASEDNNLKLSGVGVFSPAGSQPGSPTLSRRNLLGDRMLSVEALTPLQDDVLAVRRRPGAGQPGFVDE